VIAALTAMSAGATITGCAADPAARPLSLNLSSARAFADSAADTAVPGSTPGQTLQYRTLEYSAAVANAGMPGAFTAFITLSRTVTVYPSSAASILTAQARPPAFTTPADRQHWAVAGSPALTPAGLGQPLPVPAGQFSFVLQGTPLTYQQASSLPGTATALSDQVLSHLRPLTGADPPTTLVLRQLAYLIAVAPLTAAARSAAWHALAALPGLRLCGTRTDLSGRRGEGLCADAAGQETEILVNTSTGSMLAIQERLERPSPLYPTVSAGSLIQSITFTGP
jgi:hypothetical protein